MWPKLDTKTMGWSSKYEGLQLCSSFLCKDSQNLFKRSNTILKDTYMTHKTSWVLQIILAFSKWSYLHWADLLGPPYSFSVSVYACTYTLCNITFYPDTISKSTFLHYEKRKYAIKRHNCVIGKSENLLLVLSCSRCQTTKTSS